jgi:hypothetical protein
MEKGKIGWNGVEEGKLGWKRKEEIEGELEEEDLEKKIVEEMVWAEEGGTGMKNEEEVWRKNKSDIEWCIIGSRDGQSQSIICDKIQQ